MIHVSLRLECILNPYLKSLSTFLSSDVRNFAHVAHVQFAFAA